MEDLPEFVTQNFFEVLICSRVYGFIKRLVENKKIDRDNVEMKNVYYYLKKSENMH